MAGKPRGPGKAEQPAASPVLLSGGNPQIPLGYGDGPVQAYIAAVPGWKQAVCRRIDEIVTALVPGLRKAVKWNSPFYGVAEGSYFLSCHCFTRYVKVTFLQGDMLDPKPPGPSKHPQVRYLDIRETDELGEQFADWVRQASRLPGQRM